MIFINIRGQTNLLSVGHCSLSCDVCTAVDGARYDQARGTRLYNRLLDLPS